MMAATCRSTASGRATEAAMQLDRVMEYGPSMRRLFLSACAFGLLIGCQPTVKVEAPKEPITINLNIKLEAEVRVKLEEKAKEDIKDNPGVF
jgi:hypothetical protein